MGLSFLQFIFQKKKDHLQLHYDCFQPAGNNLPCSPVQTFILIQHTHTRTQEKRKELGKERFVNATATWWAIQRSPPSPPLSELLVSAHPCTCSPGSPQTVQTKIKIDAFSKKSFHLFYGHAAWPSPTLCKKTKSVLEFFSLKPPKLFHLYNATRCLNGYEYE